MPEEIFGQNEKPVVISCGLGLDISFDLEMISAGFTVRGVEVESSSVDYLKAHSLIPGQMQIFVGRVGSKTSDSLSLSDLTKLDPRQSKQTRYILKMDIEGAEMEVLPELIDLREKFPIVVFELDFMSLIPFTSLALRRHRIRLVRVLFRVLRSAGYQPFMVENWNVHLIRL